MLRASNCVGMSRECWTSQVFGDKSKDTKLTMAWRVFGDEMGIGKAIGRGDLPHLAALAQSGSVVLIPGNTAISTLHALLPEEGRLRLCGSKNPVLVLDLMAALWAPENTLEALLNRMAQGR